MTATLEILKSMAEGKGPDHALLALGYAGWSAGQLDSELQTNGWIVAAAEAKVIFNPDNDTKWEQALSLVGIHPLMLSTDIGHA
jgi:putative transcriptional regulator